MIAHALGEVYFIQRFTQTNYTCATCTTASTLLHFDVHRTVPHRTEPLCSCCSFYGYELLRDVMGSRQWQKSGVFPRVTWCDFEIRTVGGPQSYSIMCGTPRPAPPGPDPDHHATLLPRPTRSTQR